MRVGQTLLFVGLLAAGAAHAAEQRFALYLDTDNNAATGCAVAAPNGAVAGVEQVLTTVMTTSTSSAVVSRIERQVCSNGALGAVAVLNAGSWSAGIGNGTNGTAAIETAISLSLLPASGTMRVTPVSTNASGGQDETSSFLVPLGGAGTGPAGGGTPVPAPLSVWAVAFLALGLLALATWWQRRHPQKFNLPLCLALTFVSTLAGAVALDGSIADWSGISPAATSPQSGPVDADMLAVYWQKDAGTLYFRIDADVRLDSSGGGSGGPALAIVPIADRTIALGARYQQLVQVTGTASAQALAYSLPGAPSGAALNPSPLVDWTPDVSQLGTSTFTAQVADGSGDTATTSFHVTVVQTDHAPVLAAQPDETVAIGASFARTLAASDPDAGDTLTFALVSGPTGITLSGAQLAWTANVAAGDYAVTVKVSDAGGLTDTRTFTLHVLPAVGPVAHDDEYSVRLGEILTVDAGSGALANDYTPPNSALTASKLTDPDKGALNAFNADGSFTFTAPATLAPPAFNPVVKWQTAKAGWSGVNANVVVVPVPGRSAPLVLTMLNPTVNTYGVSAMDGATGAILWTTENYFAAPNNHCKVSGGSANPLAAGDIDDSGTAAAIVPAVCDGDLNFAGGATRLAALNAATGTLKWITAPLGAQIPGSTFYSDMTSYTTPAIARLAPSQTPSVLIQNTVGGYLDGGNTLRACDQFLSQSGLDACTGVIAVDGNDGSVRKKWVAVADGFVLSASSFDNTAAPIVTDVPGVCTPCLFANGAIWDAAAGTLISNVVGIGGGFGSVALAKIDGTTAVLRHETGNGGLLVTRRTDGSVIWQTPIGYSSFNGKISVGDINGDGLPEILLSVAANLYAYDEHGNLLWQHAFVDGSGNATIEEANRPAIFDLAGTGVAEVIVQTGKGVEFLDGKDGSDKAVLTYVSLLGANDPGYHDSAGQNSPVIADIDGSGHASVLVRVPMAVYGGTTAVIALAAQDNSWRDARAVFGEFTYHVADINDNGSIPQTQGDPFATPRTNVFGNQAQVSTPVDPRKAMQTTFTYAASANALTSAPATVTIDILPQNSPPVFDSTPPTRYLAGADLSTLYHPHAHDPDPGDTVTYSITLAIGNGASGCRINASTGAFVSGACPLFAGDEYFVIAATDSQGAATYQTFTLYQSAGTGTVPDVTGKTLPDATSTLAAADFSVGSQRMINASAPAGQVLSQYPSSGGSANLGSAVDLTISLGPPPTAVPYVVGQVLRSARTTLAGPGFTSVVVPVASSVAPAGEVLAQTPVAGTLLAPPGPVTLNVSSGPPLTGTVTQIVVSPGAPQAHVVGDKFSYTVTAILADGTSADASIAATWSTTPAGVAQIVSGGDTTALAQGNTTIKAALNGVSGTSALTVVPFAPGDQTGPVAQIDSPGDNDNVTALTAVTGTATDANFLRYELALAPAGTTDWTTIGSGVSPVSSGTLGTLDPTARVNGAYTLRLSVFDAGGNETDATLGVVVTGQQKLGLFTLTFVDLNVAAVGIPITVTRSYDSRDKSVGDFGVGWRLGINTMRVTQSTVQGNAWRVLGGGTSYALAADRAHSVSVTLPDGHVQTFDLNIAPNTSNFVPFSTLNASYVPEPGTLGTLQCLDNTNLLIADSQPGVVTLLDDTTIATFDPKHFRYTGVDGTQYEFDATGVTKVTDARGNSTTFSVSGITSSSGQSVAFARDSQNRITAITDPSGNVQTYSYDVNGDLVAHTTATGDTSKYAYDYQHGLISATDPAGNHAVRNTYDDSGRLVSSTDAAGHTINYTHDTADSLEIVTDRLGNQTVYQYDAAGNVVAKTDALGNTTHSTYDADGYQLTQTDPLGRVSSHTYDAQHNVLTETDFEGNTTTSTYNAFGQVLTRTDAEGRKTTNTYDGSGNLTLVTDPEGNVTHHTYDGVGNRTSTTDPLGNVTTYANDAAGNITSITGPLGHLATFTYDANGRPTSQTDALGNSTAAEYDATGRVVRIVYGAGQAMTLGYAAVGDGTKVATRTDPLGRVTSYDFDALARMVKTMYPDGSTQSKTYDAENHLLTETDQLGHVTQHTWDALGNETKTTYADGSTTSHSYDAAGRTASITDELGQTTTYAYSPNHQTVTDALGHATVYAFDSAKRRISMTDALGHITTTAYDSQGRETRITYNDGTYKTYGYDADGNRVAETGADGVTVARAYDALGHLVGVTDGAGDTTTYGYDAVGHNTTQTDANGHKTTLAYDAMGRVTSRTRPSGDTQTMAYYADGKLASRVDFNGKTSTFLYDAMGREVQRSLPGGLVIATAYDAAGHRTAAGGDQYQYDARGHLLHEAKASGDAINYTRDTRGAVLSMTSPGGTVNYAWDALGRLATVADTAGTTHYAYDAVGNLASLGASNGVATSYTYDTLNRLVRLANTLGGSDISAYDYTLNNAGRRTRVVESGSATSGRSVDYSFDNADRLTREVIADSTNGALSIQYAYDAVGNRQTMQRNGVNTNYAYDANDRITSETTGGSVLASTWDADGNLLSRGAASYTYDGADRLVQVNGSGGTVGYGYDADGSRVQRTAGATTTNYVVDKSLAETICHCKLDHPDSAAQVVAESTSGSVVGYTHGHAVLDRRDGSGAGYYLRDGSYSIRQLANASGAVTDGYTYDAFGVGLARTGASANPYQFAGEAFDEQTGLYNLRARQYQPATGRFITTDPELGNTDEPVTLHRYLYANANPVENRDPSGRQGDLIELTVVQAVSQIVASGLIFGVMAASVSDNKLEGFALGFAAGALFPATAIGVGVFAGTIEISGLSYAIGQVVIKFPAIGALLAAFNSRAPQIEQEVEEVGEAAPEAKEMSYEMLNRLRDIAEQQIRAISDPVTRCGTLTLQYGVVAGKAPPDWQYNVYTAFLSLSQALGCPSGAVPPIYAR